MTSSNFNLNTSFTQSKLNMGLNENLNYYNNPEQFNNNTNYLSNFSNDIFFHIPAQSNRFYGDVQCSSAF